MIIFVCSPFAGGEKSKKDNVTLAKRLCRDIALRGHLPLAPHLLFPQFLDDGNPAERALGLNFGARLLKICDELHYSLEHGMSKGMRGEIDRAAELKKRIREIKVETS